MSKDDFNYAEIVIRYKQEMPPTSLWHLQRELEKIGDSFTPKLHVRIEVIRRN